MFELLVLPRYLCKLRLFEHKQHKSMALVDAFTIAEVNCVCVFVYCALAVYSGLDFTCLRNLV